MAKSNPFTVADLELKGFTLNPDGSYSKVTVTKTPHPYTYSPPKYVISGEGVKKEDVVIKKTKRPKAKAVKKKPTGLLMIEMILFSSNIEYKKEHVFSDSRQFRFDLCFEYKGRKIAVEYEGLMSKKSRHTTRTGYTNDTIKYNLAQLEGWIVLRYTALSHKHFIDDLTKILSFT